jgi:hypothetical protein
MALPQETVTFLFTNLEGAAALVPGASAGDAGGQSAAW